MIVYPVICALVAMSFTTVQGAPGGKRPPSESHSGLYGSVSANHLIPGPEPILNHSIHPDIKEHMSVEEIGQAWKKSKMEAKEAISDTRAMLDNAVEKTTVPGRTEVHTSQVRLKQSHGKMKGWHDYFTSDHGREKADLEGRRGDSAHHRAILTKNWHNEANVLYSSNHEYLVDGSMAARIAKIERTYREVSDHKKANHRTGYGAFMKHLESGGKAGDIPFVSSKEARMGTPSSIGTSSKSSQSV